MTAPRRWGTTSPTVRLISLLFWSLCCSSVCWGSVSLLRLVVSRVFAGLKQLLDAQQLCDVTLLVEGKKFMCHRFEFAN